MDNTLNRRLVMLREHFAGKRGQRTFARMVGIKQQSISNYERGSVPSANVLAKIVLATGVSSEWLLTGRGTMFPDSVKDPKPHDNADELGYVDENGQAISTERLAEMLEVSESKARQFLDQLRQMPAGRERLPLAVRRADGRIATLYANPVSDPELKNRIRTEVTETEIQVSVPEPLIRNRAIRVIPERAD